jgi:threonine/homoserine/homoserine lactone efflux protein
MSDLLPPWSLLAAFLAASFVLAVTPGPGVLYIVTRSLAQGRRSGLASVAGVALGNLGNAIGASVGLAALFAMSSAAFAVVKYTGAAYLVYLGVQTLRSTGSADPAQRPQAAPLPRVFRDGFIVALFNPKTAIFFAAFLPQFMSSPAAPLLQSMLLGTLFVAVAAVTDTLYAVAASAVAPAFARSGNFGALGRYASGSVFIGLGILTAIAGTRNAAGRTLVRHF